MDEPWPKASVPWIADNPEQAYKRLVKENGKFYADLLSDWERSSHLFKRGQPSVGLQAQDSSWSTGGPWPLPEPPTSPDEGSRWLLNRFAPDCAVLSFSTGSVNLAGAIGWLMIAVEDAPNPAGSPLLAYLGGHLGPAHKLFKGRDFQLPEGEFGWLRPFLLEGSALTGRGRVMRYDRVTGEMQLDSALTDKWLEVLGSPDSEAACNQMLNALEAAAMKLHWRLLNLEASESDIEMVRRVTPQGSYVVNGSTPVVSFGSANSVRVATLGINPSSVEFLARGRLLRGAKRRLETLVSLDGETTENLDDEQAVQVIRACEDYFLRNPYRKWFDPLDAVIRNGLNVSYYNDRACHLDLVQWATDPVWGQIPDKSAQLKLLDEGVPHLRRQLESRQLQIVVVNGRAVWDQLATTGLATFQDVATSTFGSAGRPNTYRIGEGSGVKFLGWTMNLQSSHGVRPEDRMALAEWLRTASRG